MSTCSQTIFGEDISYCVIYRPVSSLWLCTISHDKLSKMNISTHLYSNTIKFESYTSTCAMEEHHFSLFSKLEDLLY